MHPEAKENSKHSEYREYREHREHREPGNSTLGLTDLQKVLLPEQYSEVLRRAQQEMGGDRTWRERKCAESRDLLALACIAPRMSVAQLSVRGDLHALIHLAMPVPCRFGGGDLVIAHEAVLGLRYPREVMFRSLPGPAFIQVLQPHGTFCSNVSAGPIQSLCLGSKLPVGIRAIELVLMSYRALTLQEHTLDEQDPAGIYRADAARWWQSNTHRIPLTREPFLPPTRAVQEEEGVGDV